MSGKRRRSWEKMAPHSKSNDGGWEGNLKNDDISRGRDRNIRSFHNDWETHYTTTTRKPYRSRSRSRGREWETFSGDRHKSCSNEYSRRRDDVRKEFGGARSQRGGREDQSNSKSRQISNIQCKFFAAGRCYRDDCRFSHDNPRSHDTWQPHADVNASWDDDEEIQRSHNNKPSWDWDDLDNRKRSWNGRPWDDDHDHDDNKTKSRNGNGTYSMDDKHRNDNNNNTHLNQNANGLDTSGKGQVEIEKSPKKKQEEEEVVGNLQYEKSRSRRDKFTANNEYGRDDDDDDDDVRNNSRNLKERPRYTHDRNSRNHYDDHDGDDGRRCHPSKIPCKFFSEGKCYRDDCKFSHDNITCHDSENNKSWNGPSWDDVASGRNRNSHDKKKSWDDDTKKPSAIHDLNSLPSNQDTKQEGKFGNDENPEKKHRGAENGKKQEEEKVKEGGNSGSDEDKCMRHFRAALVECVKEILKPIWKEGKMTREVYKTVVKKVVDKITTTIQQNQIPPTQPKIQIYLTHSQPKIMKLVEAYVEKLVKA